MDNHFPSILNSLDFTMNVWVVFLFSMSYVNLVSSECKSPNVRTVLWRKSDLHRRCWSDRDIAVLYARRLFQLVLPNKVVPNVVHLVAHFKMCFKVVKDMAHTKGTFAAMMPPMADAIGGYMQTFGVPMAIEEYYEGRITYSTVKKAEDLLNSIKKALSTDGGRWTQPIYVQTSDQIRPYYVVPPNAFENYCSDLISSADLRHRCKTINELRWLKAKVPLPFFDDSDSPKAIAVPFRAKTLYSLFDKKSRNILLRYYTAASHCYSIQGGPEHDISLAQLEFDKSFHDWLMREVVPLLHDGVWYPAFGGVYRILALMSSRGLEFPCSEGMVSPVRQNCWPKLPDTRTTLFFVSCIIGFLVMFWFVVWVFIRLRKRQSSYLRSSPSLSYLDDSYWGSQGKGSWDSQEPWDNDAIIRYSDKCDAPHGDEMLEAIVGSLLRFSSTDSLHQNQVDQTESPNEDPPRARSLLSSPSSSQRETSTSPQQHPVEFSVSGIALVTKQNELKSILKGTEFV